ncbi:FAD-binding domain-containing protein [Ceraceosorus guamensis]|uniref:FAD-binding domain-containing protein n=1 Tax=Ceraceosorus guamensis TaxID=1522189 RepID=A0A316VWW3_9BASI|nr:FAD-binding domain-containing protein [Ceraceosorus guamensis]PWN41942.1 FAD-binding domain-containing protein [Ceraceosorus guamensis]
MKLWSSTLALCILLSYSFSAVHAWQSRVELQDTIETTARDYLKRTSSHTFTREAKEVARRQVSQALEGARSSPSSPAEGSGPPRGTANEDQIRQLCKDLRTQLGKKIVIPRPAIVNLEYEESRLHVYNAAQADEYPYCLILPTSADHVRAAYAGLKRIGAGFGVRSGGHATIDGWSSTKDVMIDFKNWCNVELANQGSIANVSPGCRWGEVYKRLEAKGKTVLGGRLSNVGLGATLGGGLSHLSNLHGLIADNVASYDLITPEGHSLTVSNTTNADLWWALKGGKNRFGIVTRYGFQAYDVGSWWGGLLTYKGEDALKVCDAVTEFAETFSDPKAAIIPTFNAALGPIGEFVSVALAYNGPDRPAGVFDMFFNIPRTAENVGKKSYADINSVYDFGAIYGFNVNFRTTSIALNKDKTRAIYNNWKQAVVDAAGLYFSMSVGLELFTRQGLAQHAAKGGSPYGFDGTPFSAQSYVMIYSPSSPTNDKQKLLEIVKAAVDKTPSDAGRPLFVSYASPEQAPFLTYRQLDRLKQINQRYDPEGYFISHAGGPRFDDKY